MKDLAKISILVLSALFLFVGCHDDDGGGAQAVSNSDTDPPAQVNLSVESFSPSVQSFSAVSITDPDPPTIVHNPEPTTLLLLGFGLLGLTGLRKRLKK